MWGLAARCGPLSLLAGALLFLPAAAFVDDPRSAAVGLAAVVVMLVVVVGAHRLPLVRLLPAAIAFVSIVWSNWLLAADRSWSAAAVTGSRVLFFVLPGLVLSSFLDPFTVGDHFGQRLRLPARPVLAFVAALQRVESLGQDWAELEAARRARGLGPGRGPISRIRHAGAMTFALLVHAIRQAGRMTVAMEARGFSAAHRGGPPRTWAEPAPWTSADTLLIVVCAVVATTPALLTWLT